MSVRDGGREAIFRAFLGDVRGFNSRTREGRDSVAFAAALRGGTFRVGGLVTWCLGVLIRGVQLSFWNSDALTSSAVSLILGNVAECSLNATNLSELGTDSGLTDSYPDTGTQRPRWSWDHWQLPP